MRKPEKKSTDLRAPAEKAEIIHEQRFLQNYENSGYNRACIDWETFLPSEEEIRKIIIDSAKKKYLKNPKTIILEIDSQALSVIIKAISERMCGEK